MMLRKLVILAVIVAAVGAAVFWFVTIPVDRVRERARPAHARSRQRQDHVLCRRLRVLPRDSQPGGQDQARRRHGAEIAVRHVLCAQHLVRSRRTESAAGARRISSPPCGRALRPTARHYYPAFPYTSYQKMKFEDVRDLFAYLKTLPAIQGKVRDHDLPILFKFRRTLGAWKFLFLDGQPFKPDPVQIGGSGIAAPIWSMLLATARNVTARAISSAASSRASASPAALIRKAATVGSPTSLRRESATIPSATSRASSRPAICRMGIRSAER